MTAFPGRRRKFTDKTSDKSLDLDLLPSSVSSNF